MKKLPALVALLTAVALTLGGCGGDETSGSGATSSSSSADFSDADVTFASDMIPHHEQAVEMAKFAATRSQDAEVKKLAAEIEAAQGPEIETMTGWLEDWDQQLPDDSGHDMDHMDSGEMPGMMSSAQLDDLESAQGTSFDQMFLTMMIAHHEGAVEMARTEQAEGTYADAVALAKEIEAAQTKELATMKSLLAG